MALKYRCWMPQDEAMLGWDTIKNDLGDLVEQHNKGEARLLRLSP